MAFDSFHDGMEVVVHQALEMAENWGQVLHCNISTCPVNDCSLETWTIAQSALLGDKPNFIRPKRTSSEDALNPCTQLLNDLDALFTELQKLAGNALQ